MEPRRLFSVAEYYLMAEKGIFRPDERVELIRGVVTCMRRKSREHDITAHLLLETKAALYAEAGVPEYWLVNLRDIELVSFSSPIETRYRVRTESSATAVVGPLAWPDIELEVASFVYQPG